MSTNENTIWLGQARDNLEYAISVENWNLAMAIVADVRDGGFSEEADRLQLDLNKAMMDPV